MVFCAVFGFLFFNRGGFFWIFPLVFLGVLPAVQGLLHIGQKRPEIKQRIEETEKAEKISKEKQVLALAEREKGRITPALTALKTNLSIEDAEKILSDLAGRGYANMEVTSTGRIEYLFPEFLPPGEDTTDII